MLLLITGFLILAVLLFVAGVLLSVWSTRHG